jgi:5,6-dimethylbenzimidazole synthase
VPDDSRPKRPSPAPEFDAAFRDKLDDLFRWRRDVRRFRTDPVPEELLARLLNTACRAPSVGNSQPWRFVRLVSAEARTAMQENFAAANAQALDGYDGARAALYAKLKLAGIAEAPVLLAVFTDGETEQGHGLGRASMPETLDHSTVAAIQTLWLAARAEGLGLGWVSILDPAAATAALAVPEGWRFTALLCLGFPCEEDDVPDLERRGWQARAAASRKVLER